VTSWTEQQAAEETACWESNKNHSDSRIKTMLTVQATLPHCPAHDHPQVILLLKSQDTDQVLADVKTCLGIVSC